MEGHRARSVCTEVPRPGSDAARSGAFFTEPATSGQLMSHSERNSSSSQFVVESTIVWRLDAPEIVEEIGRRSLAKVANPRPTQFIQGQCFMKD